MNKTILVLEDDSIQSARLKKIINKEYESCNVYTANSFNEAKDLFDNMSEVSLFILDIDLGGGPEMKDGLDFARYVRCYPEYEFIPIIYISSVSERALEAYKETHCYEFIDKPFSDEAVINVVKKMFSMPEPTPAILNIKGMNDSRLFLIVKEIIYIEVYGHNLKIHTMDNDYISKSESLKNVLSMLPSFFVKCHKSFVVNTHISFQYNAVDNTLSLKGVNRRIPVGRKYKHSFTNN